MADNPKDTQDISKLVDQSVSTLQEVDRRLQMVRNDLANLIARASNLQAQGGFVGPGPVPSVLGMEPFGGPRGPAQAMTAQAPAPAGFPPFGYGLGAAPMQMPTTSMMMGPGVPPPMASQAFAPPFGAPPIQGSGSGARSTRDLQNVPPVPRVPSADLVDQGNEFILQLEMPGVKKEDLDIMVSERAVTITGTARPDPGEGTLLLSERGPVVYRRVLPLPTDVHTTQSKAQFKDGVLTLTVPKKVPTEGPRRIDVGYS